MEVCPGEYTSIYVGDSYGMHLNNYQWDFPSNFWIYNSTGNNINFSAPYNFDYAEIPLTVSNTCGSDMFQVELYNGYCGGYYYMSISPNPSFGEVTISLEKDEPISNKDGKQVDTLIRNIDEYEEWEYSVYSQSNILKEKKTKLKGKSQSINTSGWKPGVYIIRAKMNDKIISGKLIVK